MVWLVFVENNGTLEARGGLMGVGGGPCFGTTGVGAKNRCAGPKSVTSVGLISSSSSCPNFIAVVVVVSMIGAVLPDCGGRTV